MLREEMIEILVISGLEGVASLQGTLRLQNILEHGFRGYGNMSDRELAAEIEARGLNRAADASEDMHALADDDTEVTHLLEQCKEELHDW